MVYFRHRFLNMKTKSNPTSDDGPRHPAIAPLHLPCGKDPNHLGIQLSEGLNLTAFLDHLESCEKCNHYQGKLIEELNKSIGGEETGSNQHDAQ
jgi:hypothetical protein